ncbi:DUF692 family multinuclear iron-containing protein [Ahrensia sp. 13_GOM-1096m]|uniref:MNIO family bufferin maturase n=1 Tax=Ahrensia sp. 13_GOM-1096m TaxID=1380380 RepID=UPI00047BCA7E|nr:DUF692 domain-containing protein [Ahrensia sp. 13_GOM-1096m]
MTSCPPLRHRDEVSTASSDASHSRFAARPNNKLASASAGVGFKHDHLEAILNDPGDVGFLEVHAENYMGDGGYPHRTLERVRQDFPISLHGVCMSIGGPEPLSQDHLQRFKTLVDRYEPAMISEHLAWSTHEDIFLNDLLPLPYTAQTLDHVAQHVSQMQDVMGRQIFLENPATYVLFENSTMSETDFMREIVKRTGCGLLLDINNVFVSATNHKFSALEYLDAFPLEHVGEIHLAGHTEQEDDEGQTLLIDSHNRPVSDPVWSLYEDVIETVGCIPTLVEWDSELPEWPILRAEAGSANAILKRAQRMHDMAPLGKRHASSI